jgi:phosphohistidine phosphatase
MARERIVPDLVLCSSAVRTVQTLELLRPALGPATTVAVEDELYAASSDELLERVRRVLDEVAWLMLIGHNPGLQQLALDLASSGADLERLEAKFPTAALATLTVAGAGWSRLAAGDAELTAYVVPRQLA